MPKIKPKPQPLKGDGERAIPQSSSTDENTDTEAPSSLASLAERRWRSQDIIFAFGPDNSFFVSIAPGQYRWSLRPQIANVLRRQSINRTAALVLTPHGDCIAVYEQDEDGSMPVQNISSDMMIPAAELTAWAEARKQYDRLYDFLRKTNDTNEKRMVSFCVGPKASWFARRGEEVAYHDIPDGLVKKIRERRTEGIHPFQVTLGMHGSYVVVWSDESCSWELHGYEKLVPYLREKDDSVNSVALSPLKCDEWILVQDSGHVLWTLKGNATQLELVAQECRTYMQRAARRTGKTISTIQSGRPYDITPDTHFDADQDVPNVPKTLQPRASVVQSALVIVNGRSWPQWEWSKVPGVMSDKHNLIAMGAAATTSAVLVGVMAVPPKRRAVAASGSSTAATMFAAGVARTPVRRAAFAAGMAAVGTGVLCSWLAD